MKLRTILTDDDAVSPVIGVVLMVAITVILAAVIASLVLGMGGDVRKQAPQASFSIEYTNESAVGTSDTLDITHESGSKLNSDQINATVEDAYGRDGSSYTSVVFGAAHASDGDLFSSGSIEAGDTDTLDNNDFYTGTTAATDLDLSGATVRVTWNSDDGETSSTLATWNGPEA